MQTATNPKTRRIFDALESVKDPEIPAISVVDLGIVTKVDYDETTGKATVRITPTFTGCPALDVMREQIRDCVAGVAFVKEAEVVVDFSKPWSTDLISERGKRQIREFGLAPPPAAAGNENILQSLATVACPQCGGTNTRLESPFGPTLCRSVHYCNDCQQAFQGFKPV